MNDLDAYIMPQVWEISVCRVFQGPPNCEYHPQIFPLRPGTVVLKANPTPPPFFFSQTSFLRLALAVLELPVDQARLQRFTCLCLVSAGIKEEIKDVCHHWWLLKASLSLLAA